VRAADNRCTLCGRLLVSPTEACDCAVRIQHERRAPVQGDYRPTKCPPGTISWTEHLEAWDAYDKKWRCGQSAERIAERCGFSYMELCDLLGHKPTTWEPINGAASDAKGKA